MIAVLLGAAADGYLNHNGLFSDVGGFAHAGRTMLSPRWRHTYDNPWVQAGPFELLLCVLGKTVGVTQRGTAMAMDVIGAIAILAVARHVLGRRWRPLLFVGAGALLLGIIGDMFEIGHPSELFISLTWLLAARAARRDQALLAGALVGASAGFETWGILGVSVLLLLPTLRRTAIAGAVAVAVPIVIFAPFALGGDFHMFHLRWAIASGLESWLWGQGATFTWKMRIAEAAIVSGVGGLTALRLRSRTFSAWLVPAVTSLCRVTLDPVRYGYYWDTALILMLIGMAPWLTSPSAFAASLRARFRPAKGLALVD